MNPAAPSSFESLVPASASRPGDDPIFALNHEARQRAQQGEDVLNATLGALMDDDGRLAVMPSVAECLRNVPASAAAAYAPISGPPAFLDAVVADLFGSGELAERCVAVATAGGTGAIHHSIVNFLEPGQALLTTSYRWSPYDIIADHTGRAVRTFPMFDAAGDFDVAAFREAAIGLVEEQGRALVVINSPCHNPTGYSLDADEWAQVADALRAAHERGPVVLLIDAAYAKFAHSDAAVWTRYAEELSRTMPVLVAWSASKAFAQYGARVGALVAAHHSADERARIKNALGYSCRGTWSNCNHLGMLAVTELLTNPEMLARSEEERAGLRALLGERVSAFNELASKAGLQYPRYEGGFFVSVFTPDAVQTAARAREDGVFVVPLQSAVRVALCSTPVASVPRLVDALVEAVRSVGGELSPS